MVGDELNEMLAPLRYVGRRDDRSLALFDKACEFVREAAFSAGQEAARDLLVTLDGGRLTDDDRVVILDGSMYAPSTRAIDGAELWRKLDESAEYEGLIDPQAEEFFASFVEGFDAVVDADGRLFWDEGMLVYDYEGGF